MNALSPQRLDEVWRKIIKNNEARKSLEQLKAEGFPILDLSPFNVIEERPHEGKLTLTWAGYIAAIPLVPNRPSHRRLHLSASLKKHRELVQVLRRFAQKVDDPFCDVAIASNKDASYAKTSSRSLIGTAEMLENFLSWNWYARDRNPRNFLILNLRYEIRRRTDRPHDKELGILIDAAYRAAGLAHCYIDSTALDRMEKREAESRVKATRRLRSLGPARFTFHR